MLGVLAELTNLALVTSGLISKPRFIYAEADLYQVTASRTCDPIWPVYSIIEYDMTQYVSDDDDANLGKSEEGSSANGNSPRLQLGRSILPAYNSRLGGCFLASW